MVSSTQKINWDSIISLGVVMATIIGSTVPLYIHSTNQTENLRQSMEANARAIHEEIHAIHEEMKDFHGRLCAIEERNRK